MRVIVSMTSHPGRNGMQGPTLKSLIEQERKADEIWLTLPPGCVMAALPPGERWVENRFRVSMPGFDRGPIMKLGALLAKDSEHAPEHAPDDLIITVDDDIVYKPTWLAALVAAAESYPDDALGFSGWDVDKFLAGTGRYRFKSAPSACDVLEGWSGAAYRRRFFDGVDIFDVPPVYKFVDDVWISSRLHRRGITRRLIATPTAFVSNPYPGGSGLHTRYDFIEMNRLAAIDGFS